MLVQRGIVVEFPVVVSFQKCTLKGIQVLHGSQISKYNEHLTEIILNSLKLSFTI